MPIHIVPPSGGRLSRRKFLLTAAAGASAAWLGGSRLQLAGREAASSDSGVAVWALLSDTHIPESLSEQNQGFHMAANLLRVASEVLEADPSAALVNGDLARTNGTPGDYATFLKLIEPLRAAGVPIHATLGNHDDRDNLLKVLGRSGENLTRVERAGVAGKCCESLEQNGVRWLLLDSLDEVNKTPGVLGVTQLQWIERELDAAPAKPFVLFIHHNVERSDIGLTEWEALMRILRPRLQVKAVFFGHTHTWRRFVDDGIHMVNLPAVGYAFAKGQPVGWVRATTRGDGLTMELRAINGPHPDHGKPIDLPWRTRRGEFKVF